jgi:hypothetical protein
MAKSGAWRKINETETANPTTPTATMDERTSLISRATIDATIINTKRQVSQVSIGMNPSLPAVVSAEE